MKKKKSNRYNLIFYISIGTYIAMIIELIILILIGIIFGEEIFQKWINFIAIGMAGTLFLFLKFGNLCKRYDKKITSKLANKSICVKPTIARVSTFDKDIFLKNLEILNYELWKNDNIDIPVYIKVKKAKLLLSLLGLSEDEIKVMIFYKFPTLDKNIVKKIKDDKKKIILGLRKEYKRKTSLLIQIGSVVILEYSSDYFKKHITKYTAQYGREIIQDCYLLKEDNKVYVPRLFIEVDSMSLKRQLNKILNVHIKQRF